jgi:hypothetical protein
LTAEREKLDSEHSKLRNVEELSKTFDKLANEAKRLLKILEVATELRPESDFGNI